MIRNRIAFVIVFFLLSKAEAALLVDNWTSVRALGMGNAYTAVVDNADALFYNPANLADLTGFSWTIMDPHGGVSNVDAYRQVADFTTSSNLASTISQLYGKPIWAGGGVKSAFAFPGFAVAGFAAADVSVFVRNPANPALSLSYFGDYGVAAGFGFYLIPGIMKVGVSARRVNRTGNNLVLGSSVLATLTGQQIQNYLKSRGTGYGLDSGITMTLPLPIVKPSLSVVWKNMGYTQFSHEEGSSAPPRIPDELSAGASLKVALPPFLSVTPSVDYKYLNRTDLQVGKKLHLGLEVQLLIIDIRAGLYQGYYTAGAGLNLGLLKFDVATYGVELGEYPGQLEDRRYVAQFTAQLGFDSSTFNFSGKGKDGSGGRAAPRLKQRR